MSQPDQITRESIHNGFSGLKDDSKWKDSLNFRFYQKRTVVVPFKKQRFKETVLSDDYYHTILPGPDNSLYLLGEFYSDWLHADGTDERLYKVNVSGLDRDYETNNYKFLEVRGSYDTTQTETEVFIEVFSSSPRQVQINGYVYAAPENTFIPITMGFEAVIPSDMAEGDIWLVEVSDLRVPEKVQHVSSQHVLGTCDQFYVSKATSLSRLYGNCSIQVRNSREIHTPNNGAFERSIPDLHSPVLAQAFGHLVIANGNTVRWSDLNSPWSWNPTTDNEADYRILDWECHDITAIVRANDIIYIHFPEAFYPMSYIGKPAIFNISQQSHGTGAISPTAIIVHKNSQFFIGLDNFYQTHPVDGNIPIGEPVWKEFTRDCISPTKTWTYVDQANREICWVYETSSGFNRILAFNYVERHWARYSANSFLDHASILQYKNQISEDEEGNCVVTVTDEIVGYKNQWLVKDGVVEDAVKGDDIGDCLPMEQPFLETDHFVYGDIFNEKSVDFVVLDSKYELPWSGWLVEVSAKDKVSQDSEFVQKGVWRQNMIHVDWQAVEGKSLQYKFLLNSEILEDGFIVGEGKTWEDTVFTFTWDGSFNSDLEFGLPLRQEEFIGWDGTGGLSTECPDFSCVLAAWGESIYLPQRDVGADK